MQKKLTYISSSLYCVSINLYKLVISFRLVLVDGVVAAVRLWYIPVFRGVLVISIPVLVVLWFCNPFGVQGVLGLFRVHGEMASISVRLISCTLGVTIRLPFSIRGPMFAVLLVRDGGEFSMSASSSDEKSKS